MATTPQDRKPKAEAATESVTFEHGGKTYTLPHKSAMKAGMLRRLRNKGDLDFAFSMLEELCDEDTLAALDDMTVEAFDEKLGEWQEHLFGGSPGKS